MNPWYNSEAGRKVLSETYGGALLFVWEAETTDGTIYRQFDEVSWLRAMSDETFVPYERLRMSVDELNKEIIARFRLIPTAYAKKNTPWFQDPIEVQIHLVSGERLVAHWLTDFNAATKTFLRRNVIGISKNDSKSLRVVSPSGAILICENTNQSFEGE